jgi:hypothetical protein
LQHDGTIKHDACFQVAGEFLMLAASIFWMGLFVVVKHIMEIAGGG